MQQIGQILLAFGAHWHLSLHLNGCSRRIRELFHQPPSSCIERYVPCYEPWWGVKHSRCQKVVMLSKVRLRYEAERFSVYSTEHADFKKKQLHKQGNCCDGQKRLEKIKNCGVMSSVTCHVFYCTQHMCQTYIRICIYIYIYTCLIYAWTTCVILY